VRSGCGLQKLGLASPGTGIQFEGSQPGLAVAVSIYEGQIVDKEQILAILELVKAQNDLRAP